MTPSGTVGFELSALIDRSELELGYGAPVFKAETKQPVSFMVLDSRASSGTFKPGYMHERPLWVHLVHRPCLRSHLDLESEHC